VVRLEGEVPTRRARAILLRLVRSVDGVVDVEDTLRVVEEPSRAGTP
jgi:osmotically-inducible protein OsmY